MLAYFGPVATLGPNDPNSELSRFGATLHPASAGLVFRSLAATAELEKTQVEERVGKGKTVLIGNFEANIDANSKNQQTDRCPN